MCCEGYGIYLVGKFVSLSVCYHVFCNHAQRDNERAIPKGSALYRLDFKFADFRKSNAFHSYGVKTKLTSQYANLYSLTSRKREINTCVCYISGLRTMFFAIKRPAGFIFVRAALEHSSCRFWCKYLFELAISTRTFSALYAEGADR